MRVLTPFIVSTCMLIVPFAFGVESQLTKKIEQQTQLKIQYHGNAILRFENETFKQRNHRQRLRLVGRAGVNFQYGGSNLTRVYQQETKINRIFQPLQLLNLMNNRIHRLIFFLNAFLLPIKQLTFL